MDELKAVHELLGKDRTVPASDSMEEWLGPSFGGEKDWNPIALAIEVRTRACKQGVSVVVDHEPAPGDKLLNKDGVPTYEFKGTYAIKSGAHDLLADVRQAISHKHPVVAEVLVGKKFLESDGMTTVEPEAILENDALDALIVGYDEHARFRLVTHAGRVWVSGEFLMQRTAELRVVHGSVVPKS
jgi:hypothetical protein